MCLLNRCCWLLTSLQQHCRDGAPRFLAAAGLLSAVPCGCPEEEAELGCSWLQVLKGMRGGVQNVALKMLIGQSAYNVNSFRQVSAADSWLPCPLCQQ